MIHKWTVNHSVVSDSIDCSLPGSSVHGISQARILEWVAILFSRGSSQPRDRAHVSCVSSVAGGFFTIWATWEAHDIQKFIIITTTYWVFRCIKSVYSGAGGGIPGRRESQTELLGNNALHLSTKSLQQPEIAQWWWGPSLIIGHGKWYLPSILKGRLGGIFGKGKILYAFCPSNIS